VEHSTRGVAIVVPCFNLGRTVEEAVDSALDQTTPAAEIVVVDDGSTDVETRQVLARLRRPRTRVLSIAHSGVAVARNRGAEVCRAPYLVFLDADDVLARDYIGHTAARLDADEGVSFVSCAVQAFEGASYLWKPAGCTALSTLTHGSVHVSTMLRRAMWDAVGGFDPSLPAYEDQDFWLRAIRLGFRGAILDQPLLFYRVRPDSRYRFGIEPVAYQAAMAAIIEKHLDFIQTSGLDVLLSKEEFLVQVLDYQRSLLEQREAHARELASIEGEIELARDALAKFRAGVDEGAGNAVGRTAQQSSDALFRQRAEGFLLERRWQVRGRVAVVSGPPPCVTNARLARWDDGAPGASEDRIGLADLSRVEAGSLDCVVACLADAPDDLSALLGDALRALAPGGTFLLTMPSLEGSGDIADVLARILPLEAFETASSEELITVSARKPGLGAHPRTRWRARSAPGRQPAGGLILAYHRVASLKPDTHRLCVPADRFRSHMRYLADTCTPMPLEELVWAVREGALPARAVAVTLDDGCLDALTTAAPILSAHGVPATFFVNSERLDEEHEAWHDVIERVLTSDARLPPALLLPLSGEALRLDVTTASGRLDALMALHGALLPMSASDRREALERFVAWSGIPAGPRQDYRVLLGREVAALSGIPGCRIGSHSTHHLLLPRQPEQVQRAELLGCRESLEAVTGQAVLSFCYPFGGHSEELRETVRQMPHLLAVTVEAGLVTRATDAMCLPRIEITDCTVQDFVATVDRAFETHRVLTDGRQPGDSPA
jgi:peptidoglycan/xylan/chitin deacetylase (PgdA/CDA1 family)